MNTSLFDKSIVRKKSIEKGVPILEYILRTSYGILNRRITILGVSPISEEVIKAAIMSANMLRSPIKLIPSLNQVDYDRGYTGWTPRDFVNIVAKIVKEHNVEIPIIIGLDHCGPWLKDKHVIEQYDFHSAMEDAKRSLEEAILAGYDIIHIDTTVDISNNEAGPKPEVVAKRTIELIEYAEDIRKSKGLPSINYEIGSDRWIFKDAYHVKELLIQVIRGIKERRLDEARILFVVGDVGTKVRPGNILDVYKARELVGLAGQYNLFVKTHSTDYVQNPEVFPEIGIGGANIGPMFADIIYRAIKELEIIENKLYMNGKIGKKSNVSRIIMDEIINDGRWKKYVKTIGEFMNLVNTKDEYIIGLCTRYVINKPSVRSSLKKLYENLMVNNIDAEKKLIEYLSEKISYYLKSFNLEGLVSLIT